MVDAAVLIPAYKAPEKLEKCLKAVNESIDVEVEVYKHDNSEDNIGFTKAVNKMILWAYNEKFKYAVVLNQDCYLKPDAIRKMIDFMDTHPMCFIGSVKQLSDQNEDLIIHGGTADAFPFGRHIGGLISQGNCSVSKKMPWPNGACMIVRLEFIPDIGLMDPNYFLIGSDADWGFTARARGFEIWYIADAVCVHEQGVSGGETTKEMSRIMVTDMNYFREKWIGTELFKDLSLEVLD